VDLGPMLTNERMGYLALGILWLNSGLVAAAAVRQAAALWHRARWWIACDPIEGATGRFRGRIVQGPAAVLVVEQLGRFGATQEKSIVWHDRGARSEVLGGAVELDGGAQAQLVPTSSAEVWIDDTEVERAARCPDASTFAATWDRARQPKGVAREVRVVLEAGRSIEIVGTLRRRGDTLTLVAPGEAGSGAPLVVSTLDGARWLRRRALAVLLGFVPAVIAGAALCTALALTAPIFESWPSKLGGLAGLGFFLAVLPAGTAVRDAIRVPSRRELGGRWRAPRGDAAS
jgi:hypothetical protein